MPVKCRQRVWVPCPRLCVGMGLTACPRASIQKPVRAIFESPARGQREKAIDAGQVWRVPHTSPQRFGHGDGMRTLVIEHVARLALPDGKKGAPARLTLVAGDGELAVVGRRRSNEPTPAGGAVV